ncbi:hypothetical protein Hanom_Chr13g01204821 [Helianthus anomalus]
MQNPTEISPFRHLYVANLVKEHSRACNLCGRYLLQFLTFSGNSKAYCALFFILYKSPLSISVIED